MKDKEKMNKIKIEKVVLSVGATGEELEKGVKLLEFLTGKKSSKTKSKKRIPNFGIRPGSEVGAIVTIREDTDNLIKRMLASIENRLKKKQVSENAFSFGIEEYIEIPGVEYQRGLGIRGLDITVVFKRAGKRTKLRKIKRSRIPSRQNVSKEEIIKFMEEKFGTIFE